MIFVRRILAMAINSPKWRDAAPGMRLRHEPLQECVSGIDRPNANLNPA
jgi:hypothetical protein